MHSKYLLILFSATLFLVAYYFNKNIFIEGLALNDTEKNLLKIYNNDLDKINNYKLTPAQLEFFYRITSIQFNKDYNSIKTNFESSVSNLIKNYDDANTRYTTCNNNRNIKTTENNTCNNEYQDQLKILTEYQLIITAEKNSFGL